MIPDPGFIKLDHLAHRLHHRLHSLLRSFLNLEEAGNPESAKDSVRYRPIGSSRQMAGAYRDATRHRRQRRFGLR
jgi:hypothetical protein